MRFALVLLASLSSFSALATADPRNTNSFRVLYDISAEASSETVNKFGGYIQVYVTGSATLFRFCDNFEGSGMSGRPNPAKTRKKLVPIGVKDPTAYRCHDYTEAQAAEGAPLVMFGSKTFLAMKSDGWNTAKGGELLFKFARKIPLLGSPTYKTLRFRATRTGGTLSYKVEAVIPRAETIATHFMHYKISGSSLGLPNGVSAIILNPGTRTEHSVDLDNLEGKISILGKPRKSQL